MVNLQKDKILFIAEMLSVFLYIQISIKSFCQSSRIFLLPICMY